MFETKRHVAKFDIDVRSDMDEYAEILNNPLATILETIKEKLSEMDFNDEGKLIGKRERLLLVVTWEEKVPL